MTHTRLEEEAGRKQGLDLAAEVADALASLLDGLDCVHENPEAGGLSEAEWAARLLKARRVLVEHDEALRKTGCDLES